MSSPAKIQCSVCHTDITMAGAQVCPVCDPDMMATMVSGSKTPPLCDRCFSLHAQQHADDNANRVVKEQIAMNGR